MDKTGLRAEVRAQMAALPPLQRAMEEELVNGMLMEESELVSVLLLYKAKAPELSLVSMTNAAFREELVVVMPRVDGDTLQLHQVKGWHDLQPGAFGIEEPHPDCPVVLPSEIQFAAIPGVAFSRKGDRLGQGGGFYDKLLPQLKCPTVGVAFDCQVRDAIPVEAHDVAVGDVFHTAKLMG